MGDEKQEEIKEEAKPSMIESAHKTAQELKTENDRMEANIKRLEELKSFEQLSGKTDAGEQPVTKTPEELKIEGAKEFFKGTDIEHALAKHG